MPYDIMDIFGMKWLQIPDSATLEEYVDAFLHANETNLNPYQKRLVNTMVFLATLFDDFPIADGLNFILCDLAHLEVVLGLKKCDLTIRGFPDRIEFASKIISITILNSE